MKFFSSLSVALVVALSAAPATVHADPICQPDGFHAIGIDGSVRNCTPYLCSPKGGCLVSCATDADCTSEARCDLAKQQCLVKATCSADGLSSINSVTGVAKSCAPFRCSTDGQCLDICASAAECVPTAVCDAKISACITSCASDSDCPSGAGCGAGGYCDGRVPATGCAMPAHVPTGEGRPALIAFALAGVAISRRRR